MYLKGFTDGVLIVGEHAGKKVRAAGSHMVEFLCHCPFICYLCCCWVYRVPLPNCVAVSNVH